MVEKMIYKMHLNPKYFDRIKSGVKTIEIRVNDEKRKNLKTGDEITFIKSTHFEEKVHTVVKELVIAKSFEELASKIPVPDTGFNDKEELTAKLSVLYPADEVKKHGVVAIVVKKSPDNIIK